MDNSKTRKIMVVDDDLMILQTVASTLLDFEICLQENLVICSNAQKGWQKVQELEGGLDFIISDFYTGGPMDGFDLLLKTRSVYGNKIKFILMSGMPTKDIASQARRLGADGFLPKPFTLDDLLNFF